MGKMDKPEVKRRKKICTKCGRNLWLREFYRNSNGKLFSECKECNKKRNIEQYKKTQKVADGIFYHKSYGRIMVHKGKSTCIFWSPAMISYLQKHFSTTKNQELAEVLGVSLRTITRKARELHLYKNSEWLQGVWNEHRLIAQSESKRKGYPGSFKPGCTVGKYYWFKKKKLHKNIWKTETW